jgi:hypothetical protein
MEEEYLRSKLPAWLADLQRANAMGNFRETVEAAYRYTHLIEQAKGMEITTCLHEKALDGCIKKMGVLIA